MGQSPSPNQHAVLLVSVCFELNSLVMLVAMRTEILPKPTNRVMKRWQGRWFSVANTSRDPHQCAPQVQAAIPDHSPSCLVRTAYHLKFQLILSRLPKCERNDSTKGLIQKMKESRVRKRIAHAKRKARPGEISSPSFSPSFPHPSTLSISLMKSSVFTQCSCSSFPLASFRSYPPPSSPPSQGAFYYFSPFHVLQYCVFF